MKQEQDDLLNSDPETPWGELGDEDNSHQNWQKIGSFLMVF
jgi:hypothetical protein